MFRLKLTSLAIGLLYTWCVVLGNLTHSLAHHLEDSEHDHNLICLNTALVEGSEDEGVREHSTTTFGIPECQVKLAIHALSTCPLTFQQDFDLTIPITLEGPRASRWDNVVAIRQFLSVISARGPPA